MPNSTNGIPIEQAKNQDSRNKQVKDLLPAVSEIMDTRLPYNMEYVVCSLLRVMVSKGMLSISDAKRIMASGESYLH